MTIRTQQNNTSCQELGTDLSLVNYFTILREWPSASDLGIATEKYEKKKRKFWFRK